jgi:hypothetical protein
MLFLQQNCFQFTLKDNKMTNKNLPEGKKVLGLRTVSHDLKAYGDFPWKKKGYMEAPDWSTEKTCGNGFHALIKGEGNVTLLSSAESAIWQVVEILETEIVDLQGKGKFPRCNVLYSGDKESAVKKIQEAHPEAAVVYGTATAGNGGTATAGNGGTATAGDYGRATAGNGGTATAGNGGRATAGNGGTATAGDYGRANAGDNGTLEISYWDGFRKRVVIGYTGENNLQANVAYKLDDKFSFAED